MAYYFPQFSRAAGTAEIRIKAARPNLPALFLCVWFTLWTLGGLAALGAWLGGQNGQQGHGFLGSWLLGWAVAETLVGAQLLWFFGGQEVVTVVGGELRIRQQAGPLQREKAYDATKIRYLRAQDDELDAGFSERGRLRLPLSGGAVRFDYGAQTVRFGIGLPEYEGSLVVAFLQECGVAPAPR
jgi:hypothetical protein